MTGRRGLGVLALLLAAAGLGMAVWMARSWSWWSAAWGWLGRWWMVPVAVLLLAAAVAACRAYSVVRGGVTTHFAVRSATAPAGLGDQQVSYIVGDTSKGAAGEVLVTVVRAGDTTAAYETVRADHKPAALRGTIPAKQVAKLRAAAKDG